MRVLLTGFAPFPGVPVNATMHLVPELADRAKSRFPGIKVSAGLLPTEWQAAPRQLEGLLREARPDLILLEGQSALRNPSGPCGSEFILSGGARGVILQHAPGRMYFDGEEALGLKIPPVESEIALIQALGARVLAITLNNEGLSPDALRTQRERLSRELALPVVLPLEEGVEALVPVARAYVESETRP